MNDPARPNDLHTDSTCWPFYLESYTAMMAIQAGYLDDGLEITRHIQLVNMRNGWAWTQNLWRPGELTYVCAPVSWFMTDVLAGSVLDVPRQTIYLSPALRPADQHVRLPVYFPGFWGVLEADSPTKKLTFTITRVFAGPEIILKTIVARPVGVATKDQFTLTVSPFTVSKGAVLDLSANWNAFTDAQIQNPVLPDPDKTPFIDVAAPAP